MFDGQLDVAEPTWSSRSAHWEREVVRKTPRRRRRDRPVEPLVLAGHGVCLRVDSGSLLIRNGRTHYPQTPETYRFFPGSMELPPRIIMLDGSGSISFDVLAWLSEQGVPLIRLNWRGEVVTVAGHGGYASHPKNFRWQLDTKADAKRRLAFSVTLVRRKIEASIGTLANAVPSSKARETATQAAHRALERLDQAPPRDVAELRGIEGVAAATYFNSWRGVEIDIRAAPRRPVPDHWRRFDSRSSLTNGRKPKNRNASDPLNAMLNYAYGVLQAQLHIHTVSQGFDPTMGVMHHEYRDGPAYVFDLMEPERPKVDAALLRFVTAETFSAADFTLRSDGVVRLSPQLARRVCSLVSNSISSELIAEVRPIRRLLDQD